MGLPSCLVVLLNGVPRSDSLATSRSVILFDWTSINPSVCFTSPLCVIIVQHYVRYFYFIPSPIPYNPSALPLMKLSHQTVPESSSTAHSSPEDFRVDGVDILLPY